MRPTPEEIEAALVAWLEADEAFERVHGKHDNLRRIAARDRVLALARRLRAAQAEKGRE